MNATPSEIQATSFSVIYLEINWIEGDFLDDDDIRELFTQYKMDVTFDCIENPVEPEIFLYEMSLRVNSGVTADPGFQIAITTVGTFFIDNYKRLAPNQILSYKFESGLSLMIGSCRSALWNATSMGPVGPYTLPALDLDALISAKAKEETKSKTKQKKSPGTGKKGNMGIVR